MNRDRLRRLIAIIIVPLLAGLISTPSSAAVDARFFGHYCGEHKEPVEVPYPCVPILPCIPPGFNCCYKTQHVEFSVTAHANYIENLPDSGLVYGGGRVTITDHTLPDSYAESLGASIGKVTPFTFAGAVSGYGHLIGSVAAPEREATSGSAVLSADGLELELRGLERVLSIRKDTCGNAAPSAEIVSPDAGATLLWRDANLFSARITDDEDTEGIPDELLVWSSDRDGVFARGNPVNAYNLSPGEHEVTFTVTDSGGLSGAAKQAVNIRNHAPYVRISIMDPPYYEDEPITFRGTAHDPELGNLEVVLGEKALQWECTFHGRVLGTGTQISPRFNTGEHRVQLNASDGLLTSSQHIDFTVASRPPGNRPPNVVILSPVDRMRAIGPGECVIVTADEDATFDPEGGPISLHWETLQKGLPETEKVSRGHGMSTKACGFTTGSGDTWHKVRVTATDDHGNSKSDAVHLLVIPGGLF